MRWDGFHRTCLAVTVTAGVIGFAGMASLGTGRAAPTATIWFQQQDSCRAALGGGLFALQGSGVTQFATPAGSGTKSVGKGSGCPDQGGNCLPAKGLSMNIGCIAFSVPAPGTYTIVMSQPPPGNRANPGGYAACTGGSGCRSEVANVSVAANGSIQATTTNVYPNAVRTTWPSRDPNTGMTHYQGTQRDPIVYHAFGLGNGSCDGDADFDDHLTGSRSSRCQYTPESLETHVTLCPTYPWQCTLVRRP